MLHITYTYIFSALYINVYLRFLHGIYTVITNNLKEIKSKRMFVR